MNASFWKHPLILKVRKQLDSRYRRLLKGSKQIRDARKQIKEAREELEFYSFTQGSDVRHGARIIIVATATIAFATGIIADKLPFLFHFSVPDIVTGVIALGALVLGYQQWHAARNEISLDKFYERLEVTNQLLDKWRAARRLAGPWPSAKDSENKTENEFYQCAMYTYRELDNLEYAIAKYKLGYMDSENARRSLRTFRARCLASQEFLELALACSKTNCGYHPDTQRVVEKICS